MRQTALITGAAKGMGVEMALRLGKMGYNVAITFVSDGSKERADALVKRIQDEYGVEAAAYQGDVVDYDAMKRIVAEVVERFGGLNVLVCNAGYAELRDFLDETPEYFNRIIAVNFTGVVNACHVAIPYMLRDGLENPNIVVTSSVGAYVPSKGFLTYDAAKAAVVGLVRDLADEFAPKLRVNSIAPGGVKTDLMKSNMEKNPEYFATLADTYPLKRFVEMSEIADGLEFLINAKAVTGITLPITSGLYMS